MQSSALTHVGIPDYLSLWLSLGAIGTTITIQYLWNWKWLLGPYVPHKLVVEQTPLDQHLHTLHVIHYQQAHDTPFTIAPLSDLFGEYTETAFSNQFHEGK
eukprot:8170714-Ditylum_brightwellii.AAC.1